MKIKSKLPFSAMECRKFFLMIFFPLSILQLLNHWFSFFAKGRFHSIKYNFITLFLSRSISLFLLFYRCSLLGDRNHMFISNSRKSHYFLKQQKQRTVPYTQHRNDAIYFYGYIIHKTDLFLDNISRLCIYLLYF